MIDNVRAVLIYEYKSVFSVGSIMEMVIWEVPSPIKGSSHSYKYRLYWGRDVRMVGYDNERGKGDHCHLDGEERPYKFVSVDTLLEDFYSEVYERMPK